MVLHQKYVLFVCIMCIAMYYHMYIICSILQSTQNQDIDIRKTVLMLFQRYDILAV